MNTKTAHYAEDMLRRKITWTWDLRDLPFDGEGFTQVVLEVHHDKSRKEYSAGLQRQGRDGYIITFHIAPGEYLTVMRRDAARYSAKQLREFAEIVAAEFDAALDSGTASESIRALMEGRNFRKARA